MKELAQLISDLQEHGHYQAFLKEVSEMRPIVPRHDPIKENTEEWKQRSGQQQGYDLFASLLNIKFGD